MPKDIRIMPRTERGAGHSVTFVLAIGAARQVCRLQTNFETQSQANSYFHKHRNAFEHVARTKLSRGEMENDVIQLTML